MKISIVTRIAATTAVAGAVLLGGAGVALADDTVTPTPVASPQAAPGAPDRGPTVLVTPEPGPSVAEQTAAPVPAAPGQVRQVPDGAAETGGGATASTIVGEPGPLPYVLPYVLTAGALLVAAGAFVAVRRRA